MPVASPRCRAILKPCLHRSYLRATASDRARRRRIRTRNLTSPLEHEDPSDRLLDVETQLGWLREHGFDDVDCYWKWLEMALLVGVKPEHAAVDG